ncbi:rod shape-determining protein MreC [Desulfonatronovibrio magnus]|uniref:rod shape-determining protein MreC n=1 Tax=Desulfonatronovibrio magnus TaxID=698827 RepID=UPI0005EB1693|nr:rod shape-determining protein MreC [Desulfonatronovibrio magnus]
MEISQKKIIGLLFLFIILYLSLYTWNARSGVLDRLAAYTGLEFVGWVIKPGKLLHNHAADFWSTYIDLVAVHKENKALKQQVKELKLQIMAKSERAASASRLESMLGFAPPSGWQSSGARVVAHDFGPIGALNSLIVDKGKLQGVAVDMPVIHPDGVVGRTFRNGLNFSSVLILSDPNSRIPVISSETRVPGIISGQGYQKPLTLQYVHLNSQLEKGEMLVTSGLAGIYPKGLPVARVSSILRSEVSLFLIVEAEPMVDFRKLEEIMVLNKDERLKIRDLGFEG